jgi:hypothetical protein
VNGSHSRESDWSASTAWEAAKAALDAAGETRERIAKAGTALSMAYVHLTRDGRPETALAWVEKAAGHLGLDLEEIERTPCRAD